MSIVVFCNRHPLVQDLPKFTVSACRPSATLKLFVSVA